MKTPMSFRCLKAAIERDGKHPVFQWKRTFPAVTLGEIGHQKVSPVLVFRELVESCEQNLFVPEVEMHNAGVKFHPGLVFGVEYVFFLRLKGADVLVNHRNHADFRFLVWNQDEKVVVQGDVSFFFP